MISVFDAVSKTSYPGRGIVLGTTPSGRAAAAYFIMGRSQNSRNRVFAMENGVLRTLPRDPSKVADPSLIIYAAARTLGEHFIVTNGDQTDTIYETMKAGGTFENALRTREFEPDAPNFTPRVSGMLTMRDGAFAYKLAILKKGCGCERFFFEYEAPTPGHFLHTYDRGGDPLPSFTGEPEPVAIGEDFAEEIWKGLDAANKIALFARVIDPKTGEITDKIINKPEDR